MSFWKHAESFLKEGIERTQQKIDRIESYKMRLQCLSDEELHRKYKISSGEQKQACYILLKERGYGENT